MASIAEFNTGANKLNEKRREKKKETKETGQIFKSKKGEERAYPELCKCITLFPVP